MKKEIFKSKLSKVLAVIGVPIAICVAYLVNNEYQHQGIGLAATGIAFLAVRYIPFFILMRIYYRMEIKPIVSVINTTLFLTTTAMGLLIAGVSYFFYEPAMAVVLGLAVFLLTSSVLYYFTFPEVTRNMTKAQIINYRKTAWIYCLLYHKNMFIGQWTYIQKNEEHLLRRLVAKYHDDRDYRYKVRRYDDDYEIGGLPRIGESMNKAQRLERFQKYQKELATYRSYSNIKYNIRGCINSLEELKSDRIRYANRKLKHEQCDEASQKIIAQLQEEVKALEKLIAERGAKYRRIVFMSM